MNNCNISKSMWKKANKLILNGVQTYSKSPIYIASEAYPIFVDRGKGAYIWDLDGNRYIDYPLALGPVILGYSYEEINSAVKKQIDKGILFSFSNPLEIELAELLCDCIPSAEKVRFFKSGSEAISAAVRIARAYTENEVVAVCGYHGWHDWTVVRTTRNAGVPSCLNSLIYEFEYNNIDSLQNIFDKYYKKVAAVIIEPVGMYPPKNNFLEKVATITRKNNALLIFDEIITGFRLSVGGAQSYFSIKPDLSAFGKAMANSYPISAVVGNNEIMKSVEDKIFISSTYGGDLMSISAALKTISILKEKKVNDYIVNLGQHLKDGLNDAIFKYNIKATCEGMPHKSFLIFNDAEGVSSKTIETYFRQICLKNGVFLGYGHFVSFSHTEDDIKHSIDIACQAFDKIKEALQKGLLSSLLKGIPAKDVFRRY